MLELTCPMRGRPAQEVIPGERSNGETGVGVTGTDVESLLDLTDEALFKLSQSALFVLR